MLQLIACIIIILSATSSLPFNVMLVTQALPVIAVTSIVWLLSRMVEV